MTTIKVPHNGFLTKVKLLPCPFCGGAPKCNGLPRGILGKIFCSNDDCFGPMTTAITKADSVAQWNKRPTPPASDAKKIIADTINQFNSDDFVQAEFPEVVAHRIISELEWRGFRIVKTMMRADTSNGGRDG